MDYSDIVVGILGLFGTLVTSKKVYLWRIKRARQRKVREVSTKAENEKKMFKLIEKLREHYKADRTILYYTHNGTKALNGYCFYFVTCLFESYDKQRHLPIKHKHQSIPAMLLADFFRCYREVGVFQYHNKNDFNYQVDNIEDMLMSDGVKSTYSYMFNDLDGNPICNIVMNFLDEETKVTDFEYFKSIGESCGFLMSNNF